MLDKTVYRLEVRLIVEWDAEDEIYIGSCRELFRGGVHGDDPTEVLRSYWKWLTNV